MKSLSDILNSGSVKVMEDVQDTFTKAASHLLSDEAGVSAASYVALMATWRLVDPAEARLADVDCRRCGDGRYRLDPDSDFFVPGPDYRVDVTSP